MITPADFDAIIAAAGSFRIGAPMVIEDIRIACWADGHPVSHLRGGEIASVLARVAVAEPHPTFQHRHMWRARPEAFA